MRCDGHDADMDHSYQLGISAGLERASGLVMEAATFLWKSGKDDQAERLRGVSRDLEALARQAKEKADRLRDEAES